MKIFVRVRPYFFVALFVVTNLAPFCLYAQDERTPAPIHHAGEVLVETEKYVAYKHPDAFCSLNYGVNISLVLKVSAETAITDNEEYRRRFEEEIFPLVAKQCKNTNLIYLHNYVYGSRIYHRLGENYDSAVITYDQRPPKGGQESPLNTVTVEMASNKFTYRLDGDYRRVDEIRKNQAMQESARIEAKQNKIKKRREDDLVKAADVLTFYKRNAPTSYDFTGYSTQAVLQNIYSGNFEPFTGGYETRQDWVSSTVRSGFGNANVRDPFGFLLNLSKVTVDAAEIRGRRDALDGVFYAYHLVYKEQCFSNQEIPWDVSALIFYLEKRGERVPGSETKGNVYFVREPFLDTFDGAYGNLGNNTNVSPPVPESLANDFRKFLKSEGCSSAAVRYFETNLYLATEWMLPLQQLQDFIKLEKPRVLPEAQAPKPKSEKPKPKTRRKH